METFDSYKKVAVLATITPYALVHLKLPDFQYVSFEAWTIHFQEPENLSSIKVDPFYSTLNLLKEPF